MERRRIRLVILIPALMLLLTLGVGIVNYQITATSLQHHPERTVRAVLQDLSARILTWSLVITAIAVLFGVALAYSIVRPIRSITRTAQDITRGQLDRKVRLPIQPLEIGELGSSFNSVVDYLNQLFSERNRFVLESFSGGLLTTDTSGNVTQMNSAAENLLHISATRAIGKNLIALLRELGSADELIPVIVDMITHKRVVTAKPVTVQTRPATLLQVNSAIMKDRTGHSFGYVINFRDLSKIQEFHARMQRADNLAALGSFAMGIAHELRNPLAAVKGITQLLYSQTEESTTARTYCTRIIREVDRLDRVIQAIHDFSHQEPAASEATNLNVIAHDALELARIRLAAKRPGPPPITVIENYAQLPRCRIQPERTMQALLNIIINALEATPSGGTATLRSFLDLSDKAGAKHVALEISNTGTPIPEDQVEKIFDPFYTTKPDGTGLGLPIAYQIVTYNNGEISVTSNDEKTTFTVRFPLAEDLTP
jgi:two-component system sensor histidine kinase AtoS